MPVKQRFRTNYPGVYFIEGTSTDGRREKIFYIHYRKGGKLIEEKAGRQFKDNMSASRASRIRSRRIEGDPSNQERRETALKHVWTISRLWQDYVAHRAQNKSLATDRSRFQIFIEPPLGSKQPIEISPLDVDRLRIGAAKNHLPQTVNMLSPSWCESLTTAPGWATALPSPSNLLPSKFIILKLRTYRRSSWRPSWKPSTKILITRRPQPDRVFARLFG